MAKRITVLIGLAFLLAFIVPNIINADDQLSIIDAKAKYASITRTTPQEFEVITTLDVQYLMLYAEDGKTLVRTYGVTGNSIEKDGWRVWTVSHTIKDAGSRKLVFKGGTTNATPSTNSVIVPFKVEKTGVISAAAKYEAIRMRTAQEFTVQTTSDANYLVEYAEDGKTKVKTWTASSSNSVVSGNVRTWTVTQTIQDPGKRNLFFRAGTTSTPTSAQKSAAFRVEDTWVIEATAQTATIGKGGKQTFIVKTSSNAQYLMLYGEGKNLVKTWVADSTNSVLENDVRIWNVDLAINTAGNRELVIKSGKTQSPSELSGTVVFKVADKTVLNASALLPSITKTSAQEFEVLTTADVQHLMLYAENGTPLVKTWAASGNSVETDEKFRIWTVSLAINTAGNRNLIFKGGTTSKTPVTNAVSVPFKVESTGVISASAKYESIPRKTEQEFTIQTTSDAIYLVEYAEDGKTKVRTWTASSDNSSVSENIRTWTVKQTIQDPGKRSLVFRAGNTSTPSSAQRVANFEVLPYVEISVLNQPKSVTTGAGPLVQFTIEAIGAGELSYQWQTRKDTESDWTNAEQSDANNNTLSVETTAEMDGWQFRCIIADVNGQETISDSASLVILPPPSITGHPLDQVIPVGAEASFYVYANGQTPFKYQWQIKKTTDIEWQELDQYETNASTVRISMTRDMQDCQLRCIVTDRNGVQAISNTANITLRYYDLPINVINFPDDCFREYIRTCLDKDQDQQLSLSELRNTTYIETCGMEISSLKGIELFFSLTGLACKNNHIADLDISCNTQLSFLDCSNNKLSSIDVSNNPILSDFRCNDNNLTDLNLSENLELAYLDCYHNHLKHLNLETNNKLAYLYHDYETQLVDIERENYFMRLYDVPINENTFPDTAFRQYILNNIDIDNNYVLSPEERSAVTEITVCGLNISTLEGIQEFERLTVLDCSNNQLIEINLPENNTLTFLDCRNNLLTEINVTDCNALKTLICDTETTVIGWCWESVQLNSSNFPDTSFRQYLSDTYDKDRDGTLNSAELRSIKELWFVGSRYDGIMQLKGIELLPFLETLNCHGCSITSLDVRNNKQLKKLICYGNSLRALDVSGLSSLEYLSCGFYSNFSSLNVEGCTSLKNISCNNTKLSVLDVSTNTELETLDCQANNLSSLVFGSNSKLTQLKCDVNRLTNLDVSSCNALTYLSCNNNALKTLDLRSNLNLIQLKCDKNQLTSLEIAGLAKLEGLFCADNLLKCLDVRGTMLTTINCDSSVTITWDEEGISIDETNFPDEIFRDYVLANIDKNKNGLISEAENIVTTEISVPNSDISSLKGIEFFTNLEVLNCSNNNLSSLYLETNTKLKTLECQQNNIASLDLSYNTQMTTLWCWENNLSVLIMSGATELETLNCSFNSLSVIDLSDSAKINHLRCDDQTIVTTNQARIPINEAYFPDNSFRSFVLDNMDLDQDGTLSTAERKQVTDLYISNKGITSLRGLELLTSLMNITCSDNDLKTINLTRNIKLKGLNCSGNELANINVCGLTKLEYLNCSDNNLEKLDVSTNEALAFLFVDEGTTVVGANDSLEINMGN